MSGAERLLDVLVTVATADAPCTAKQVGELTGMPLSSAYRHLTLLRERGFVEDLGRHLGYAPGPVTLRMAWSLDRPSRIASVALPEMQKLGLATQESVGLMKAVGAEVLCVEMLESPQSLRCSFSRGRSQPLIRGASAKALLAHFAPAPRAKLLDHLLGPDAAARAALERDLETVRARGFAESEGEVDAGVWGVSAPVFSFGQRLEGAISLMVPAPRVGDRRDDFIALTVETAAAVSAQLHQP